MSRPSEKKYAVGDDADKGLVAKPQLEVKKSTLKHNTSVNEREIELTKNAHMTFALFDTSGSGFIEKAEMQNALLLLGMSAEASDVDTFMAEIDEDGDGLIQPREFQKFYMSKMGGQRTL